MDSEERLWWNVLVEAEIQSEIASGRDDGPLSVRYMNVANRARKTLRDQFGVDLDVLYAKAQTQIMIMEEEEAAKEREEQLRTKEYLNTVQQAKDLLNGKTS